MITMNDFSKYAKDTITNILSVNPLSGFCEEFNTILSKITSEVVENSMQYEQVSPYNFDIPDDVIFQLDERKATSEEYEDWTNTPEGEEFIENYFINLENEFGKSIMAYEIKTFEDAVDIFGSLYYNELSSYNLNTIVKDIVDDAAFSQSYFGEYTTEDLELIYNDILTIITNVFPDYQTVNELIQMQF